jgi:hypothetical protein
VLSEVSAHFSLPVHRNKGTVTPVLQLIERKKGRRKRKGKEGKLRTARRKCLDHLIML